MHNIGLSSLLSKAVISVPALLSASEQRPEHYFDFEILATFVNCSYFLLSFNCASTAQVQVLGNLISLILILS